MATANAKKKEISYVELFVPRGTINDDPNLYIGINGVGYLLPRGKTSSVPDFVKAEYERSIKAEENFNATVDAKLDEANQAL